MIDQFQQPCRVLVFVRVALVGLYLLSTLGLSTPAQAQARTTETAALGVSVVDSAEGLRIRWGLADSTLSAASIRATLPRMRYQGYELPMQLLTVELQDANALSNFQFDSIQTQVLAAGMVQPAAPLIAPVIDSEGAFDLSQSGEVVALPAAPVFVLRSGMLDGKPVAILAVSPIYQENEETKIASAINFVAPGMKQLNQLDVASLLSNTMFQATTIPNLPPNNPAATKKAAKIIVSTAGMQRVPFSAILATGLATTGLGLTHNGVKIATQIINNELRFYAAPSLADRWNSNEIYWLTADGSNLQAMALRSVAPSIAISRTQAIEKGTWRQTAEYISRYGGPDGDHWFNAIMDVRASATITGYITATLPAAGGTSYNFQLSPLTRTDEERHCGLRIKTAAETLDLDITAMKFISNVGLILLDSWSGVVTTTGSVSPISVDLRSYVTPKNPANPIQPTPPACAIYFDTIDWQRSVSLNFNGKGAAFSGVAGMWNYQWSNLPAVNTFYDVSQPISPTILINYSNTGFQDGTTAKDYIMVGNDSWQTPQVVADTAFDFYSITGAQAIYIIAPGFAQLKNSRTLLDPLVKLRQNQGYTVAVIDVQEIYDGWSFGKVSPAAIRNFLQFTATNWNPKPLSVVLVGDATIDPKNWGLIPSDKSNNFNFIPPFMAQNIDPWLGEAACDNCYGQLNGSDAVVGDDIGGRSDAFFDVDVWIGRFPVKNELDLKTVVDKISAYETATDTTAVWRGSSIFVADNYVKSAINNQPIFDPAGNFAKDADTQIARLLPQTTGLGLPSKVQRIYYDPYPQYSGAKIGESWRITNPTQITPKIIEAVGQGAGLFVYNGHSNHWNMGNLEQDVLKDGVMKNENVANVLTLYDADRYSNRAHYFIQLSMTCLTAQFVKPAASGTTIDERSFLASNGGSVLLWGPAGLSVAHGHDKLQDGFINALHDNIKMDIAAGQLIEAGMQELLLRGTCCQDALHTFVVFGDPLTPARVFIPFEVFLPITSR